MMKKLLALMLSASMVAGLTACGTTTTEAPAEGGDDQQETPAEGGDDAEAPTDEGGDDAEAPSGDGSGKHVFMFKSTGNSFGDLMFEG